MRRCRLMLRPGVIFVACVTFVAVGTAGADESIGDRERTFFESRIRPVLIEHCYECHSSGDVREGDLAVDHRDAMRAGGSLGSLFSDETPEKSLLLRVIRHDIDGLEMPQGGPKLSREVVSDFETWIGMGSPDPRDGPPSDDERAEATGWQATLNRRLKHWSWQPIRRPAAPQHTGGESPHPIDRFVHARLHDSGLSPSPPADKMTLLRRLTFALTGLPPTPQQVASFRRDDSPAAYATLVDSLLESPAYGERWARHWMDWIRYAESHGSEGDPEIPGAWRYRDYLIRALNADVPYDQLVREHVAGDLLEKPRTNPELGINESVIGAAHWRMVFHGFAPTDAMEEKVRFTDDAIDVFSKAFLGMTVSCARCHDHKFDAISQADYYAMFGILGSARPGREVIDLPSRLNRHRDRLAELKSRIRDRLAEAWRGQLTGLGESLLNMSDSDEISEQPDHLLYPLARLRHAKPDDSFAARWARQLQWLESELAEVDGHRTRRYPRRWNFADPTTYAEAYIYGNGLPEAPQKAGGSMVSPSGDEILTGVFPASVYSGGLTQKDAARLTVGDFPVDRPYELWLRVAGGGGATTRYVVQNYPRRGTVYRTGQLSDDGVVWKWQRYDLDYWQGDSVHFELAAARDAPLLVKPNDRSWFAIREAVLVEAGSDTPPAEPKEYLRPIRHLVHERGTPQDTDEVADLYVAAIRSAIEAWQASDMTDGQATLLNRCVRRGLLENDRKRLPGVADLLEEYRELEQEIPVPTRVPSLDEWRGDDQPLMVRGDHKNLAEPVPRRFLEAIDPEPYETRLSGRRRLADDLLRRDNPLTRRVIVNRVWHHLVGAGLVRTPDNFGALGEPPTHPELLDYLASRFSDDFGWSLKRLVRFIVTSETWKQSSRPPDGASRIDPANRLLSRASVRRLEAEAIRDSLLAVSGQLNLRRFGRPVTGTAERRSVYVGVVRNDLDPFLNTFDAPVPFSAKGRRDVTNVPAQSLMMLNDSFVRQAAAELAGAVAQELPDAARESRIDRLWLRALGRNPFPGEVEAAERLLGDLRVRYRQRKERRASLGIEIERLRKEVAAIREPVRERLEAELAEESASEPNLEPISSWDFTSGLSDTAGNLDAQTIGTARLSGNGLVLDGGGYAATSPLGRKLAEKSLAVTLHLEDLAQQGGGVMSVQSTDGKVFDAIVYAERRPKRWLAGSNNHRRTQDFGGTDQEPGGQRPTHLVITYASDGTITAYRNGERYGQPYRTSLQPFEAGQTQVLFGLRHGTAVRGNRAFRGRLLSARLYDRVLSVDEVAAAAQSHRSGVTDADVDSALSDSDRTRLRRLRSDLETKTAQLRAIGEAAATDQPLRDLAHSVLNLKEFIYVR